ncbi:MAG: hypothetical protein KGL39_55735 [Patescibacteria group bacterium]|nr:hypothetical protein [Patescibacteria group bacterium]
MPKKKKPVVTYKIGAPAGVVLIRETIEESLGSTQRRTSFIGIIHDKEDAAAICEAMNKKHN